MHRLRLLEPLKKRRVHGHLAAAFSFSFLSGLSQKETIDFCEENGTQSRLIAACDDNKPELLAELRSLFVVRRGGGKMVKKSRFSSGADCISHGIDPDSAETLSDADTYLPIQLRSCVLKTTIFKCSV